MFKSIRTLLPPSDSSKPTNYNDVDYIQYEVIDDDFVESFSSPDIKKDVGEYGFIELSKTPPQTVAHNIILSFIILGKRNAWTIKGQADWNLKHNKNYLLFQAEDGIRDWSVTGVQTCALPIYFGDDSVVYESTPRRPGALMVYPGA